MTALARGQYDVYGSFKMSNVTDAFGTVDQDRLAALRAELAVAPDLTSITSRTRSVDTGTIRHGASQASHDWVPLVTLGHLALNIDTVVDHGPGQGSAWARWTISGRRANGDRWSYTNANHFSSLLDISLDMSFQIYDELLAIRNNLFEPVTIDSIEIRARAYDELRQYAVDSVRISINGAPFETTELVEVSPGDQMRVKIRLRNFRYGATATKILTIDVPADATGSGILRVFGGANEDHDPCAFSSQSCTGGLSSQLAALDSLRPTNRTIVELEFFGLADVTRASTVTDRVTAGGLFVPVLAP